MRIMTSLLLMAALSPSAHAAGDTTKFEGVQVECAQVGEITFGTSGRWPGCRVTRGRWVGTINYIDLYQAQYCLGGDTGTCDQRALVIFGNRAYMPEAKALLVRVDTATTEYEDPLIVISGDERIMSLSAHDATGAMSKNYYLWRTDHWIPMEAQDWQHGLSGKLPADTSVRQSASPDLETMHARVNLFHPDDADCCPTGGLADVELELKKEQFAVRQVTVGQVSQ